MKLPRRQFLHLAAGAVALPAASSVAMMPLFELEAPSGVDVDTIGKLLDLRTEILRARGADECT